MSDYDRDEVEKFRHRHQVTPSGVVFDWWLANQDGAGFCLIRETHTTDEQIEQAKKYLRAERDVVGAIKVATVSNP
jgi:hypothetical protein